LIEIVKARTFDIPDQNYVVAALHGLILTRLDQKEEAQAAFKEARDYVTDILSKTPTYHKAIYARGLAQAGLVLVAGMDLQPAIDTFKEARGVCAAPGVVADQLLRLDELMKCEGGEILAPVRASLAGEG